MYINKLHLRAFGKFVHKRLYIENKFNIIYGENEAGKSTVHNFIEAMLYGFDDDIDENRYNKYKPWSSNLYKGTLGINDNAGIKHLISKDFLLGTTEVYKKNSDEPEMHEEEIISPGEHFFNMSKISYNNTVNVRQLGNKTEKELATELKNKIVNLSKTRDESISIDRIIQSLSSIKDEAGDENNNKTLLGQYSLRLKELNLVRENSINGARQVMFLVMEKKKLNSKIQELNLRIEELNKEVLEYELSIEKDKFLKAEPIKNELDEINEKLSSFSLDNLKQYSENDFKEAVNLESLLNSMYVQKRNFEKEVQENEEKLETLLGDLSNKFNDTFDIEELNSNFKKYETNISKIKALAEKIKAGKESISSINISDIDEFLNNHATIEDINRKIEISNIFLQKDNYEKVKRFRASKIRNVVLLILIAGLLIAGTWWAGIQYYDIIKSYIDQLYLMQEPVRVGSFAVSVLIILIFSLFIKPNINKIKGAKNEIESMECEFADYTILLDKLDKEKQEIIKSIGCENYDEIVEKYSKFITEKSLYEEKNKLINYDVDSLSILESENEDIKDNMLRSLNELGIEEINSENIGIVNESYSRKDVVREEISKLTNLMDDVKQNISKLDKDISFEEKRLDRILSNNDVKTLENFKEIVDYNERYTELINNRDYKQGILYKIIGDESFEDIRNRTKAVNFYEVKKLDTQEHQLNIFKLSQEKTRLNENIDNIIKEIDEIESNTRSLAEVEEEIDFYENKIKTFKRKIKVAEIAADKIIKISDSIKGDFMPLLRKSISDNFAYLTGGKYSDVIIDEDMNITVVEADNNDRNVELESLSGGTLDQLYLSLRVGLGNILSGNKNIPLIFDDSFVQYDSKRLKNTIEMLARESERRQIILFTCQEREAELTKQMNIKFNFIKLV